MSVFNHSLTAHFWASLWRNSRSKCFVSILCKWIVKAPVVGNTSLEPIERMSKGFSSSVSPRCWELLSFLGKTLIGNILVIWVRWKSGVAYDVMCPCSFNFSWMIMSATIRSSRLSRCSFHEPCALKGLNVNKLPKRLVAPCHSQVFRHGAMIAANDSLSMIESHLVNESKN